MKTRLCLSWFTASLLCSLFVGRELDAGPIIFSQVVLAPDVGANGDVVLVNSTDPTVNILDDGFSLSRSYMLDAIKNNGNGTSLWTASSDFTATAITDVDVRIKGDTNVSFTTGDVLFTVSATVFDVNSGKVTTAPVFQTTLTPGGTPVSWDETDIIKGVQKSTEPFDDTLSLQSSVLWTGFKAGDVLTVGSLYSVTMDAVPEPSSWVLLSTSLLGVLCVGWRRMTRGAAA